MFSDSWRRKMRACFTTLSSQLVQHVIVLSRIENGRGGWPSSQAAGDRAAASSGPPGRVLPMGVAAYISSLPKREQHELTALMLLGREPHFMTVRDVKAVCSPEFPFSDPGRYMASKGNLERYLRDGSKLIGL